MSRPVQIDKDVPITEIRKIKSDLKKFVLLYEKITFIEEIYAGKSVKEAMESRNKSPQTGYKWIKEWNENGIDALFRKSGSGRQSKLSDYQFEILKENIIMKGLSSVSDIRLEIQKEFGVTYSKRHLRRLIFDLGLGEIMKYNEK